MATRFQFDLLPASELKAPDLSSKATSNSAFYEEENIFRALGQFSEKEGAILIESSALPITDDLLQTLERWHEEGHRILIRASEICFETSNNRELRLALLMLETITQKERQELLL